MNIEKYKGIDAIKQIKHDMDYSTRMKEINHINSDLIGENVYLTDMMTSKMALERYQALMESVDAKIKDDTVTLGSIICTLPKDFEGGDKNSQVQFLKDVFKELTKKIGGLDNVVYGVIHFDEPESRPHLEFKFCPIITDIDKRCKDASPRRKFCWDKLCNRDFYNNLHKDIQKAMLERGYSCKLVGDVTIREQRKIAKEIALKTQNTASWDDYYKSGNKSIQQLKNDTAAELVKARIQLAKTKEKLSITEKKLVSAEQKLKELEDLQAGITNLRPDVAPKEFKSPVFSVDR